MIDDGVEDVADAVDIVDTVILFPVVFSFVTDFRLFVFGLVAVIVLLGSLLLLPMLVLPPLLLLPFELPALLLLLLPNAEGAKSAMRAVVGFLTVDVPQTLGCEVTNHGGLGRDVVVDD